MTAPDLLRRLAEGPGSPELDALVALAMGWTVEECKTNDVLCDEPVTARRWRDAEDRVCWQPPPFSESVDAILPVWAELAGKWANLHLAYGDTTGWQATTLVARKTTPLKLHAGEDPLGLLARTLCLKAVSVAAALKAREAGDG